VDLFRKTFDTYFYDSAFVKALFDVLAYLQIFMQSGCIGFFLMKPYTVPCAGDFKAESDWIYFLSHVLTFV
jgi:hypothetical protein